MKLDEESKKIVKYALIFLAVIVSTPLILGAIIPIESTIPNFSDSNDWIGFLGSYIGGILGGLCTLIVMYFTRKDTREIQDKNLEIQNELIELQKDNNLKSCRTSVGYYSIYSGPMFKSGAEFYKGSNYVLSQDTIFTEGILLYKNHSEGEKQIVEENIKNGNFASEEMILKKLIDILKYENFKFFIIENAGNNPMYNINIKLKCQWFDSQVSKIMQEIEENYSFPMLKEKQSFIFPQYRLNRDIEIEQLRILEFVIRYDNASIGLIEETEVRVRFLDNDTVMSNTNVKELNRNSLTSTIKIPMYRIL